MPRLSQAKAMRELTLKITYYGSIFLLIIHTNYMAVYIKNIGGKGLFILSRRFFIQQFPFQE